MAEIRLISPCELRGIVTMEEAVEAVHLGFLDWGRNSEVNAPRRRIHIPTGVRVSVHQGGVPSAGATGLMTHCEWVKPLSDHQEYSRLNHPVIVLYDSAEGALKAIIIGEITCSELPDNVAVTGLRTAATSAVGTDALARKDAGKVGILGSGGQARNHLLALAKVRKIQAVKVYSRTAANCKKFAADMSPILKMDIEPVKSPRDAVQGVDIILTATNSSVPVFDGDWLEPGVHITSIVGSNVGLVKGGFAGVKRRELDDTTLRRTDVLGIASVQQAVQDEQGDIFDPVQKGILGWEQLIEISAIIAGKKEGRSRPGQITMFKNNAGQGVADVALGALVLQKAGANGKGQVLRV